MAAKQSIAPIKSEFQLHMWTTELLRRLAYPHVFWWHTPNGEKRDKRSASKLKVMGVLPGVLDLQIWIHSAPRFMEFKFGKEQLSEEQKRFIDWCSTNHIPTAVVRTQEEAAQQLEIWGAIRPTGWQFRGIG